MGKTTRLTTDEFIRRSKNKHGDKYNYSKVEYKNNRTKVCIICPEHGEFWQLPKLHLNGSNCPLCANKIISELQTGRKRKYKRKKRICRIEKFRPNLKYKDSVINDTETFVMYAKDIHNNKYDYSEVEYKNNKTKVCIICPEHGEFWQTPCSHLKGHGCNKCAKKISQQKQSFTKEDFVYNAKLTHTDKYDYSKVEYKNNRTKVCIICPEHGEFWQRPGDHINGQGCPKCAFQKRREQLSLKKEDFIKRCNDLYHNKYSYDDVEYINNSNKVKVRCKKHDIFLVTPANHLKGRGCPICKCENYVYEERMYDLLKTIFNENDIERQYKADWLSRNKSIDFYIPKYKIGIEHQGSQHFKPIKLFGGEAKFQQTKELDVEKFNECKKNNINLLYFSYEKYVIPLHYIDEVFYDEVKFKSKIKKLINYETNE